MLSIGIRDSSQQIARLLCPALINCGFGLLYCADERIDIQDGLTEKAAAVISGNQLNIVRSRFDIFVLGDSAALNPDSAAASLVVAPETADAAIINSFKPKSVVSYGICGKNTVTVSSLIDSNLVISIQREIVSLSGKRIVEQELKSEIKSEDDIDPVLACVSVLLLLDVPIETIEKSDNFPAASRAY